MKIIQEVKKKYFSNPDLCPFCESDNISGDEADFEGKHAYRKVVCEACDMSWVEIFELTNISDAKKE